VTSDLLAADRARRGDERRRATSWQQIERGEVTSGGGERARRERRGDEWRRRASEARAASGGEARAARAELGFGEEKGPGKKKVGEKDSWPAEPFFTPKSHSFVAHPAGVRYG
jgi:hypothetical protein